MSVLRILSIVLGLGLVAVALSRIPRLQFVHRRKWLVASCGLVLIVLGAIGSYAPQKMLTRAWLILSGGLVDVGGYRLRVECNGTGKPVVVMDAGLAQDRSTWGSVPAGVAKFSRACTYDRAGLGESDAGPSPRTSQKIVDELYALLTNAKIPAPYILVGHSFGGTNVWLFSSEHPDSVAGMVFDDSSHPDQASLFAALMSPDERATFMRQERGENYERVDLETSMAQVRAAVPLPPIFLTVLSSDPDLSDAQHAEILKKLQAELAALVPNSKHIVVAKTGHFIQLEQPQVVIDAISEMVNAVRQKYPTLVAAQ